MRVIAGKYRSRRLNGPGLLRMRPTSDRLRETLFNVLGPAVEESLFVDIFAGTGAVGIEALSRGAREAIFIESHAPSARLIRQNLASLEIAGGASVIESDAMEALKKLTMRHILADFLFLDPPYSKTGDLLHALEYLDGSRIVAPHGIVIAEHDARTDLPDRLDRLERSRLIEQGDASLSFYRLAAAA